MRRLVGAGQARGYRERAREAAGVVARENGARTAAGILLAAST